MVVSMSFFLGGLGAIGSFGLLLAPLPTFNQIRKKKNAEGFQSGVVSCIVSLLSSTIWIYYALLHIHGKTLILVINIVGCIVYTGYIITYLIFASKKDRITAILGLAVVNVLVYGAIVGLTFGLSDGSRRIAIVGWISSLGAVTTFTAPLGMLNRVMKTQKSDDYLPKTLCAAVSLCYVLQILCAAIWLCYGILMHDFFVALPNLLGLLFAATQVGKYMKYQDEKSETGDVPKGDVSKIVVEAYKREVGDVPKVDLCEIVVEASKNEAGDVSKVDLSEIIIEASKSDLEMQPGTKLPVDGVVIGVVPFIYLPYHFLTQYLFVVLLNVLGILFAATKIKRVRLVMYKIWIDLNSSLRLPTAIS